MKARYCLLWLSSATILVTAMAALGTEHPCNRNAVLETWLAAKAEEWDGRLAKIPGYEPPGPITVCQVTGGGPRSEGGRIYLPPLPGEDKLLSLAHEYVHLAFRHHPASRNEGFVERTSRALVSGEELQ